MPLVLTEEQSLLREMAREFVADKTPVAELRRVRDEVDPDGFSRALWSEMAELGWASIPFAEEFGGADLGAVEAGVILQECGRTLAPTPFLATVMFGGAAVAEGGSEALRKDILPGVCSGERLLAVALEEITRHAPYRIATTATATLDGFTIDGAKQFVLDGHVADQLVVVARSKGEPGSRDGLTLLLVDADTPGVSRTRTHQVDGRNAARIEFSRVAVDAGRVLGEVGRGADVLDRALDSATAGLCAEMLGGLEAAFDRTLDYLKTREQFGVLIGSFQALKHRAAEMYVELELSRSIVLEALQAVDARDPKTSEIVSIAKARLSDAVYRVGNEGVQMHGGIGVTDEEDIGLYLKRFRVQQFSLGDADFHRDRYASLKGY